MKTYRQHLAGLIIATTLLAASGTNAVAAVNVYFNETFNDYTVGATGAALASSSFSATNPYNGSGGAKVYDDFGGSGLTPSTTIFGSGERFLNVNRDLVATTNSFTGGYVITTEVAYINGFQGVSGKNTFSATTGTSDIALQVMLRMSSPTAYDGLVLRFTVGGSVQLFSSNGSAGSGFSSIGTLTGFPNLTSSAVGLEIVDTGSDISIYANTSLVGTFENVIYGAGNAGFLAFGQSGQYNGTKFNEFGVAAIPEPKTTALIISGAVMGTVACMRRRN